MKITSLDKEQLKDIIRANGWDDKPSLKVSEREMQEYVQGKLDSGELKLGNIEPTQNENNAPSLADVVQSSADEASKEEIVQDEEVVKGEERMVNVALLKPVFLESGVKTMPTFDSDSIATKIVSVSISVAKAWQKNGICHING